MEGKRLWLAVVVFFFSLVFHAFMINEAGRTWDEQFKVDLGFVAWGRWAAGDFSEESWRLGIEHPMVAKYIYGLFLPGQAIRLSTTGDQTKMRQDFNVGERIVLSRNKYIPTMIRNVWYAVDYDWTLIRLVSAVFNSLALAGVFVMATWFLADGWALLAPAILLFTPRFLAMGKQLTYESITVGLVVWTVILFDRLMTRSKKLWPYVVVGLACGLVIFTRYNNVYIFVLLVGWWLIRYRSLEPRLALLPAAALLFGFLTWPLLWHSFPRYLIESIVENGGRPIGLTGYYPAMLLVTTPGLWLVGLVFGGAAMVKKKSEKGWLMLWWLVSVVAVFSFFGIEGGGTRYIFFIYPPLAVTAAVGWHWLLTRRRHLKYLLIALVGYGLGLTVLIHPYYLDYYNELVGGVAGAVERGYEISWWGEGQREVGQYLNKVATEKAKVALLVTPRYVMPPLRSDLVQGKFGDFGGDEDYVIVSRADVAANREKLEKSYELIYEAKAGGVGLVSLWRKKG